MHNTVYKVKIGAAIHRKMLKVSFFSEKMYYGERRVSFEVNEDYGYALIPLTGL